MNDQRLKNGVRKRHDNKGDGWAYWHRKALPRDHYMQDIDCLFGVTAFGHNTSEKLFLEPIPAGYEETRKSILNFVTVAMFDRKSTKDAAFNERSHFSKQQYLYMCRTLGKAQPVDPKFFYVIGTNQPDWLMIELDIYTGEETGNTATVGLDNWTQVWNQLGISGIRNELQKWIQTKNLPT